MTAENISDLIKVGGGVLGGGVFSVVVTYLQGRSAIQKSRFERRTRILDEALSASISLQHKFTQFHGKAMGYTIALKELNALQRNTELDLKSSRDLCQRFKEETMEAHIEYAAASASWIEVRTKLLVLNEPEAANAQMQFQMAYSKAVNLWSGSSWKEDPEKEALPQLRASYETFLAEMRKAFAKPNWRARIGVTQKWLTKKLGSAEKKSKPDS